MNLDVLQRSRALWNRQRFDLRSDESLAQIMDRGVLNDWRALYQLAQGDASLRQRLQRIVETVPLGYPHFWLAALQALGEEVDWQSKLPEPDSGFI